MIWYTYVLQSDYHNEFSYHPSLHLVTVASFSCDENCQDLLSCPAWCSSVHWPSSHKQKSHWFGSHSGHMPGFWARSPAGDMWEVTTRWYFSPTLSPFLPLCLKINNIKSLRKIIYYLSSFQIWYSITNCSHIAEFCLYFVSSLSSFFLSSLKKIFDYEDIIWTKPGGRVEAREGGGFGWGGREE